MAGYLAGELAAWAAGSAFSPLEQDRLETALEAAGQVVANHDERGDAARNDEFFVAPDGGAPWGGELFEAAMKAAARDHESRKALHLGRFWANVAYAQDVDVASAGYLLRVASGLTYRQLVLLALFSRLPDDRWQDRLEQLALAHADGTMSVPDSLKREIQDLAEQALVGVLQSDERVTPSNAQMSGNIVEGAVVHRLRPREAGVDLASLLDLGLVPVGEFEAILAEFGTPGPRRGDD
jgi:hypothetical protein